MSPTNCQCPRCFGRGYLSEDRKPSKRNPNALGFYARTCPRCAGTGSIDGPIVWEQIREHFVYGYLATVGNRGVEVIRVEAGQWHTFPQRDGQTIHCGGAPDYQQDRHVFRTLAGAKKAGAEYLRTGHYFGTNLDALPVAK